MANSEVVCLLFFVCVRLSVCLYVYVVLWFLFIISIIYSTCLVIHYFVHCPHLLLFMLSTCMDASTMRRLNSISSVCTCCSRLCTVQLQNLVVL